MENLNISIFYWFNQLAGNSKFSDAMIVFFASYLANILIAIFIIWLIVWKQSAREKIKVAITAIFSALFGRLVFVEVVRFFYHHPRPFAALPEVNQLLIENSYSFPSGHATFFFALSAVIYNYNKKLGVIFFVGSAIMGIARITAGVHYPLDIIGGAIGGAIIGFGTCALIERLKIQTQEN